MRALPYVFLQVAACAASFVMLAVEEGVRRVDRWALDRELDLMRQGGRG